MRLTKQRNPAMIGQLRKEALPPLIEGARWQSLGHSLPFLIVLGRIADIPDAETEKLIHSGKKEEIIQAAKTSQQPAIN